MGKRYCALALVVALAGACRTDPATAPESSAAAAIALSPAGPAIQQVADFTKCDPSARPDWFAYRDGDGPWTVAPGTGPIFRFAISSRQGAIAYVTHFIAPGLTIHIPEIFFFTRGELARFASTGFLGAKCAPAPTKLVHVSLAGNGSQNVYAQLGRSGFGSVFAGATTLDLRGVSGDVGDFFASLSTPADGAPTRFFLSRNVDVASIPDGGFLPFVADFAGAGSFDPLVTPATVTGMSGETNALETLTLTDCRESSFLVSNVYGAPPVAGAFSIYGIPAGLRLPNERQFLSLFVSEGAEFRQDARVYRPGASPSLVLPPIHGPVSVTQAPGPYLRLRFAYRAPFEHGAPFLQFATPGGTDPSSLILLAATPGYAGGADVALSVPDFSGLPGWDNAWAPPASAPVSWIAQTVSANGFFEDPDICLERISTGRSGSWAHGAAQAMSAAGRAAVAEGLARAAADPRGFIRPRALLRPELGTVGTRR